MFTKLYITTNEADLFHMYDNKVKKEYHRDIALLSLITLGTLFYLPFGIALVVAFYLDQDPNWFYAFLLLLSGVFWHIASWNVARYNKYLSKYLRHPEKSRELMETLSDDYMPIRLFLYNSKYNFVKAYIENSTLVMEFTDGLIPHTVSGFEYHVVNTTDPEKRGVVVLDLEGLTVYHFKAENEMAYGPSSFVNSTMHEMEGC